MHLCPRVMFPLKKKKFTRCVAQLGGEDKTKICFAKTCRMLFHNTFLLMDVKFSRYMLALHFQSMLIWDNKKKTIENFKYVSIKATQSNLQKCII